MLCGVFLCLLVLFLLIVGIQNIKVVVVELFLVCGVVFCQFLS